MSNDTLKRDVLPIPDHPRTGPITYDAKDPETKYPPIEQMRPPKDAPNVLIILIDDVGFGASSAFGGPCADAERRTAGGGRAQIQSLSHDGAVLAVTPGAADRTQPSRRRHGRDHGNRERIARLLFRAAQHGVADRARR